MLAVPALRALRTTAGAPLALAAEPRLARLLAALGVVDTPLGLDSLGLDALFACDTARTPRLPAASRIVSWLGARDETFARRLRALAPGAVVAPSVGEDALVWEHLLATVGNPSGEWCGALAPSSALREAGAHALRAAGWDGARPLVIVHPGAGGADKRWPAAAFAASLAPLADRAAIIVHRGPADSAAVGELRAVLGAAVGVLDEPELTTLAGALTHAAVYIGTDSGPSHLAAAVGTACVALYAERNLAWRPWARARVVVVQTQAARSADIERVTTALRAFGRLT